MQWVFAVASSLFYEINKRLVETEHRIMDEIEHGIIDAYGNSTPTKWFARRVAELYIEHVRRINIPIVRRAMHILVRSGHCFDAPKLYLSKVDTATMTRIETPMANTSIGGTGPRRIWTTDFGPPKRGEEKAEAAASERATIESEVAERVASAGAQGFALAVLIDMIDDVRLDLAGASKTDQEHPPRTDRQNVTWKLDSSSRKTSSLHDAVSYKRQAVQFYFGDIVTDLTNSQPGSISELDCFDLYGEGEKGAGDGGRRCLDFLVQGVLPPGVEAIIRQSSLHAEFDFKKRACEQTRSVFAYPDQIYIPNRDVLSRTESAIVDFGRRKSAAARPNPVINNNDDNTTTPTPLPSVVLDQERSRLPDPACTPQPSVSLQLPPSPVFGHRTITTHTAALSSSPFLLPSLSIDDIHDFGLPEMSRPFAPDIDIHAPSVSRQSSDTMESVEASAFWEDSFQSPDTTTISPQSSESPVSFGDDNESPASFSRTASGTFTHFSFGDPTLSSSLPSPSSSPSPPRSE